LAQVVVLFNPLILKTDKGGNAGILPLKASLSYAITLWGF